MKIRLEKIKTNNKFHENSWKFKIRRFRIHENMWWTCYRLLNVIEVWKKVWWKWLANQNSLKVWSKVLWGLGMMHPQWSKRRKKIWHLLKRCHHRHLLIQGNELFIGLFFNHFSIQKLKTLKFRSYDLLNFCLFTSMAIITSKCPRSWMRANINLL